jgi:hypothetical protein
VRISSLSAGWGLWAHRPWDPWGGYNAFKGRHLLSSLQEELAANSSSTRRLLATPTVRSDLVYVLHTCRSLGNTAQVQVESDAPPHRRQHAQRVPSASFTHHDPIVLPR